MLQRALQAPRAKIILTALQQCSLEFHRQHFFQDRDIFIEKLFLQIDRVRGNDRFFVLLKRKENCRDEISERFSHARARFDHEMSIFLQRLGHGHRHFLLLRPIFEILRFREQAVFRKDRADPFDEICSEGVLQGDHYT